MTAPTVKDLTTGPEAAKAKAGPDPSAGIILLLVFSAITAWMIGVGASKGFGVHAPFVATWMLVLATLAMVRLAGLQVAGAWWNVAAAVAKRAHEAQAAEREAMAERLMASFAAPDEPGE